MTKGCSKAQERTMLLWIDCAEIFALHWSEFNYCRIFSNSYDKINKKNLLLHDKLLNIFSILYNYWEKWRKISIATPLHGQNINFAQINVLEFNFNLLSFNKFLQPCLIENLATTLLYFLPLLRCTWIHTHSSKKQNELLKS